jgi:ferrochelatase
MIEHWHLAPGMVPLLVERVHDALESLPEDARGDTAVVFTAHSIPTRLVEGGDPYPAQVLESATAIAAEAGLARWSTAWQSAGRTAEPWLGPDIGDVVRALPGTGAVGVVVCPVGFVSDHLEILYDLDIEARAAAVEAGIPFARTASLNDDPRFCQVLAGVVLDVTESARA